MQSELSLKVDRIADYLRAWGIYDPLIAVEQVAHLIYLKILDEESSSAGVRSEEHSNDVFPLQAKRYRWTHWIDKSGRDLLEFIRNQVFYYLSTVVREDGQTATYFRSAKLEIEDPGLISALIAELDSIEFCKLDACISGSLLEQLLAVLAARDRSNATGFLLGRTLVDLVVELAEPSPKDSIFDPTCQFAELLTGAIRHMKDRFGKLHSSLQLVGEHSSNRMLHIATVNLMLYGIRHPDLKRTDRLAGPNFFETRESLKKYDIVLTHIPLEQQTAPTSSYPGLPKGSKVLDAISLSTLIDSLSLGGKCAAIVPNHLLGSSFRALRDIRARLVNECEIQAVVSLPSNYLIERSSLRSSILVFRRTLHPEDFPPDTQRRNHVWFYELNDISESEQMIASWQTYKSSKFWDPPGFNGDEIVDADIDDLSSWWTSYAVLEENHFSLVASDYKPFVWKNEAAESPIELVENAIRNEREIELDLKDLLNKLKSNL